MGEIQEEEKNKGGRPPFYSTPEELQAAIDKYFAGEYRTRKMVIGNKKDGFKEIEVPAITISDLVIYLGFCDRHSFYAYEARSEGFSHTIKRARSFIAREYEQLLNVGNPAGAIFALKNFGWSDKQEIEVDLTDKAASFVMNIGNNKDKSG